MVMFKSQQQLPVRLSNVSVQRFEVLLFGAWLLFLCCMAAFDNIPNLQENHKYVFGDWLINYQGGFVRRGFVGELLFQLAAVLNTDVRWLVYCVQVLCYPIFFSLCFYIICSKGLVQRFWIFIISPAIFQFQFNDPIGGYRKELLMFVLLGVALTVHVYRRDWLKTMAAYFVLAMYPALILSHELFFFFISFAVILNKDIYLKNRRHVLATGLLLFINAVAFSMSILYSGDLAHVVAICSSLGDFCSNNLIENGAITWLAGDSEIGSSIVAERYFNLSGAIRVLGAIIISGIPFLWVKPTLREIFSSKLNLLMILGSVLGVCAVAMVAIDWGRFIYMLVVCLFLLVLRYSRSEETQLPTSTGRAKPALIAFYILYALMVSMPHVLTLDFTSRYVTILNMQTEMSGSNDG